MIRVPRYFVTISIDAILWSSGAAAGVAAAFGAPIGGVLFSLEEASSFWSLPLTWGVFFTAMISTFTVNILMSAHKGDIDAVNDPGLITFGSFVVQPYRLFEIPIFALIAVCGGLLGAFFNFLNIKVNRWRKEFFKLGRTFDSELKVKLARCAESIFVAWFTATMFYWIPYAMRDSCRERRVKPRMRVGRFLSRRTSYSSAKRENFNRVTFYVSISNYKNITRISHSSLEHQHARIQVRELSL